MNEARRKLLMMLLIIIFVLGTLSSFLFANAYATYEGVLECRHYANSQMNAFLDLSIDINRSFLGTIEEKWEEYVRDGEVDIESFIRQGIVPLKQTAYRSLIMVVYDGDNRLIYSFSEYQDFNPDDYDLKVGKIIVIDDSDAVFGTDSRFYIEGINLYHGDQAFDVYVGFSEQVVVDGFISLVEMEMIDKMERKIMGTVVATIVLILSLLVMIIYIVYYAQCLPHLMRRSVDDDVECYKRAIEDLSGEGKL